VEILDTSFEVCVEFPPGDFFHGPPKRRNLVKYLLDSGDSFFD
jgi:hypothetical protein